MEGQNPASYPYLLLSYKKGRIIGGIRPSKGAIYTVSTAIIAKGPPGIYRQSHFRNKILGNAYLTLNAT